MGEGGKILKWTWRTQNRFSKGCLKSVKRGKTKFGEVYNNIWNKKLIKPSHKNSGELVQGLSAAERKSDKFSGLTKV